MSRLLPLLYMCPQLLLLLPQRRLLLASHCTAAQDHHNRLVSRLLPIGRATRHLLVHFTLVGSILIPTFATLLY